MEISLVPSIPASLRVIPSKYNIIIRLWTHAFHKLLEALRRALFSSPLALEHLQDFIYYDYPSHILYLSSPFFPCGHQLRKRGGCNLTLVHQNHLHGMLFTNIQFDDFSLTLARFLECIEIEGAEEHEWIMMAVMIHQPIDSYLTTVKMIQ